MLKKKAFAQIKIMTAPSGGCLGMILIGLLFNLIAPGMLMADGPNRGLSTLPNKAVQCCPVKSKEAEVQEIRFGFYPRFRYETLDDLFMTLKTNGEVYALAYSDDGSSINAAYKGTLSGAEMRGWLTRVDEAFREYAQAGPRDENVITEGDLFYLSMKRKSGAVEQMGRKVADVPPLVAKLVEDLSVLWKRLKKTAPAPGYLRSVPMDRARFESLQRNSLTRFSALEEFPTEARPVIIEAIRDSFNFKTLTQAQFDKLRVQKNMVLSHEGSGYELYLYSPQTKTAAPHK